MFHYKHSKIIPQFPADPETRTHRRFIWGGDLGKQEGGHGGGRQRDERGKGESPHSHRGRQRCPAGFSPTVSSDGPTGGQGSKMLSPEALPSLPPLVESRLWDGNSWMLRAEQASLVPGKPQTEKQRGAGAGGQKRSLG